MRTLLFACAIFLGFFLSFSIVAADECGQTPTDHCTISTSTTFTPGNYQVENITIIANDTVVDCNSASFTHVDGILFNVGGTRGVTIKNCYASDYGRVITNEPSISLRLPVEQLTISDNVFTGLPGYAIYLINAPTLATANYVLLNPFPNHQIMNNTITGSGAGILIDRTNNSIISDNTLEINGAPNYEGIYLVAS